MVKDDFINIRKSVFVMNGLIIVISVMVLTGWMFDIMLFKSIMPSYNPMNPLTAVSFLLSGISLYLLNCEKTVSTKIAGKALALAIILIAIVRLVGFIDGYDVKIDKYLFASKHYDNRMVLHTAFNFLLMGLSLFFFDKRKTKVIPSQIFSVISFLVSFLSIMGYVYALDKQTIQIPMALHTASSSMLLTIAILFAQYKEGFISVIMHKNAVGAIFRSLLIISASVPFFVALFRYSEHKAALTQTPFGTPALIISIVTISFFVMWYVARKLNKADERVQEGHDQLVQLKNELAESENKYRNLVDNAGVMMYTVNLKGVVTFASNKTLEITGYTPTEFTGMHYSQCINKEHTSWLKISHRKQVQDANKETVSEFCITTKKGKVKWIEQTTVLIFQDDLPSGFHCIAKDISEAKKMEEALKKSELMLVQSNERLQSILDNASSLIYIKDLEGKYVLTNKKFKAFYDIDDDVLLGETDFNFSDNEQAQRFKETDETVLSTGSPLELEEIIQTKRGKFHMLITKFPLLDAYGTIYGISGIGTDITERAKYREHLIEARKVAEDAKKMQEQFLANMSHEIRTPLNGIQGMTSLLLDTELDEEQSDFAKTIQKSSDNLIVIINDILDFSKITAGKLAIEKIDFNIVEVVDNLKAIFRHRVTLKGIMLQFQVQKDVPVVLNGDPYRLNQILVNLIGNAIKFTNEGGVFVDISVSSTVAENTVLNFIITDTGIGIQEDKLNDIFESFTQASIETSRKYGGTGLGLAITKQLLELQGGTVSVKSKINSGTTFEFSIPYNNSIAKTPVLFAGDSTKDHKMLFHGKKFLVAEDNEINQKVIRQVIQKAGGTIDIANNGLEAVGLLKMNNNYHLIIMDLQMPEMDGYAATKYIRNVMNINIPIVAMTASALKGERLKCIEIGMNDYLTKPFNVSFIYQRLGLLLKGEAPGVFITKESTGINDPLFDLCLLEEMEDEDYLQEILEIFLEKTSPDLQDLRGAVAAREPDNIYAIAHKLKSSIGLIKANKLLKVLCNIENAAKSNDYQFLSSEVDAALLHYNNLVEPLQLRLEAINIHSTSII